MASAIATLEHLRVDLEDRGAGRIGVGRSIHAADHRCVARVDSFCPAVGDGDLDRDADLQRTVGEAARHAIAAGVSLASIADAEQIGHERAREELGPELLRRVERAARRRREAEREYEHAVVRAGELGLAHRDVAAAAQVAHGTVRAIIARAELTIEPVFAQTVFNRKLTRFHRRGHAAVHSEWRLITTTHNLLKRHSHRIAPTPT